MRTSCSHGFAPVDERSVHPEGGVRGRTKTGVVAHDDLIHVPKAIPIGPSVPARGCDPTIVRRVRRAEDASDAIGAMREHDVTLLGEKA